MKRVIHVFDNGVKVYDDHLLAVQRQRCRKRNIHEADEEDIFAAIVRSLPADGCLVNIGAAIGYYAILAKRLVADAYGARDRAAREKPSVPSLSGKPSRQETYESGMVKTQLHSYIIGISRVRFPDEHRRPMSFNFLPYAQDQDFLLPPSLKEWVPEDSLAHFVSDTVDQLNAKGKFQVIYGAYRADGWGRAAYHPVMMVKVLLYAYAVGIRSSREIERSLHDDVAFRYLVANQTPNFRTIADFRKDHAEALKALFTDSLEVCAEAGLVKLGRVALDGRKVRGNAALDRNRRRAALEKEVQRILTEAEKKDAKEDQQHGLELRGDELPSEVRRREKRLESLEAALERLATEEEQAKAAQQEKIRAREEEERLSGKKKRGRKPKAPEEVVDPEAKANLTTRTVGS